MNKEKYRKELTEKIRREEMNNKKNIHYIYYTSKEKVINLVRTYLDRKKKEKL
jgi:hypothetical protein